jgi:hypothetical protein
MTGVRRKPTRQSAQGNLSGRAISLTPRRLGFEMPLISLRLADSRSRQCRIIALAKAGERQASLCEQTLNDLSAPPGARPVRTENQGG